MTIISNTTAFVNGTMQQVDWRGRWGVFVVPTIFLILMIIYILWVFWDNRKEKQNE